MKLIQSLAVAATVIGISVNALAYCPGVSRTGDSEPMSDAQIEEVLRAASFPEETIPTMVCIAAAESTRFPTASCTNASDSAIIAYGLFQIYDLWFKQCTNTDSRDYQIALLSDPGVNAKCAWRAFRSARSSTGDGYTAWNVYNDGQCHGL